MSNIFKENSLGEWAETHIFYNTYTQALSNEESVFKIADMDWRKRIISEAPHGKLLTANAFFSELKHKEKIYLAHITPNLHNILSNNNLYPSAGCLVGSVYCTPVTEQDGSFYLHNLGDYIMQHEAKHFSKGSRRDLSALLIEIELPSAAKNNLIGIDYLRLGNIHFRTYKELEYLLSPEERFQLKESCVRRVKKSFEYLSLCSNIFYLKEKIEMSDFLRTFSEALEHLPILGYFYFEVLSEYIMLFQNNKDSLYFATKGEFYSPTYKNLVYDLCPHIGKNFSLQEFRPTFDKIVEYLRRKNVFNELDINHLSEYLIERLAFLTTTRLFNSDARKVIWHQTRWDFDYLSDALSPLLGHLIHRELRNFGKYPAFYFYFDQYKALQIWNYWNHMNIAIPFNGILPKGEVGINPAYPDLKYKIFTCSTVKEGAQMRLLPQKEVAITIAPKLIDLKFTTMRNKHNDENPLAWNEIFTTLKN